MTDIPSAKPLTVQGHPLVPEIHVIFGSFGMSDVRGIAVLNQGIFVQYENGMNVLFEPVFQGFDRAITN